MKSHIFNLVQAEEVHQDFVRGQPLTLQLVPCEQAGLDKTLATLNEECREKDRPSPTVEAW